MSDLIGPIEAAEILEVTRQWVTSLLRQGVLFGRKVGQRWVIERNEVLRYRNSKQDDKEDNNKVPSNQTQPHT